MGNLIRILYVDDSPLDRELVRDALEKETGGFQVVEAASRVAFETALADGEFDLVLTDFNILGYEGLQVIDTVHTRDECLPVVIVTGTGSEEVAVEAMKRGASDYVIKSASHIRRLPLTIHAVLENARLQEEHNRAEQNVQRQIQRLRALHTVDEAITSSLDVDTTFNVLLEQVISQLGVDAATILLLDQPTETLEYATGRGFDFRTVLPATLRLGEDPAGRAALEGRTIHIPDIIAAGGKMAQAMLLNPKPFVAYYGVPLIARGQVKGVMEIFHRTPLDPDLEWLDFMETLAGQAAIAIDDAQLFTGLQRSNSELMMAYDATIEGWSRAMDLRDKETEGHTQRVIEMTMRLAREAGMSDAALVHVRRGGLLHDMGKLGVPDSILLKPGKLTDEEWVIMRRHPKYAYDMLSSIEYLRPALDIPYCHHEKWDGTGYPCGLKGEQIPLSARLFAVVDVWDALRSDRPYRAAWSQEKTLEYIRSLSGTHFDPKAVELFFRVINASTG
jgi:response regulator RpfG family c-di-GMP phosphodiesterase